MSEETTGIRAQKWPYTSFKTLLNWIQRLAESGAVPPRIDRSILPGSEGQKTQVFAALRFLGLVAENGDVTPLLTQLVNNEKERPKIFRGLLAKHYPEATHLGSIHATAKQLEETFEGTTGDTTRKAVAFYLHAAKFAQHPISKNFKVPTGFRRVSRPRAANGTDNTDMTKPPATIPMPLDDLRARYIDLLMEKAKSGDGALDESLLNRIEKLLGYED
jgi:hypothetical protein